MRYEGIVDLLDGQQGLAGERQVPLTVDRHGAALARLLVELHVTGLALERQRVRLGPQRGGLLLVDGALVDRAVRAPRRGT